MRTDIHLNLYESVTLKIILDSLFVGDVNTSFRKIFMDISDQLEYKELDYTKFYPLVNRGTYYMNDDSLKRLYIQEFGRVLNEPKKYRDVIISVFEKKFNSKELSLDAMGYLVLYSFLKYIHIESREHENTIYFHTKNIMYKIALMIDGDFLDFEQYCVIQEEMKITGYFNEKVKHIIFGTIFKKEWER